MEFLNPKIKICYGIEIELLGSDKAIYRFCKIEIQGKELNIQEKRIFNKIEDLISALDKKIPLAICFTGKSILTKSVEDKSQTDISFEHLFPGVNSDDFYQQMYHAIDEKWLSICRKDILNSILGVFKTNSFDVLTVSLGAFTVSHVIHQLNAYDGEIIFNGYKLFFDKDYNLKSYNHRSDSLTSFKIKIGITEIEESYLISYAIAYQLAMQHLLELIVLDEYSFNENYLHDFLAVRRIKNQLIFFLGSLFIFLLINFSIYKWLLNKNQKLLNEVNLLSSSADISIKLSAENKRYKTLLDDMGWIKKYNPALLIDQVNLALPQQIRLTEMLISPAVTKDLSLMIIVKGQTQQIKFIDQFIQQLRSYTWVKDVYLDKLVSSEDSSQNFEIWIRY